MRRTDDPQQRILAGHFNAWPGATENSLMTGTHADSWALAKSLSIDYAYSGNAAGDTRNSRIDYVFHSKQATRLELKEARVFDTRNSSDVMPSGHRLLMGPTS